MVARFFIYCPNQKLRTSRGEDEELKEGEVEESVVPNNKVLSLNQISNNYFTYS